MKITADNFLLTAAKYYDDVSATDLDFQEDVRRFLTLKRLLNQYKKTGELKTRLILNHIIILLNVFGDAAVPMILFKLSDYNNQISAFLYYLNRVIIKDLNQLDPEVIDCLLKI